MDEKEGKKLEGTQIPEEALQLLDSGELNPWSRHPRYSVISDPYITWEDEQGEEHPASMHSIFVDPQVQVDLLELYLLREGMISARRSWTKTAQLGNTVNVVKFNQKGDGNGKDTD